MSEVVAASPRTTPGPWPGWCCSYCASPLEIDGHGATCARERRWFATHRGVHRLLTHERRRELLPALEAYRRARRDERRPADAAALTRALSLARERLGGGPWRVLDVGAGGCWASAHLLALGHSVAAVDIDLDEEHGLLGAERILEDPARLPRAEADMEALPLEPASMDLVLAAGVLHHAADAARTLVELRRVTRREGLLVAFDSPVYRRPADGQRTMAERVEAQRDRYGFSAAPFGAGYLVLRDLTPLFARCGWRLEVHGWPDPIAEVARDLGQIARWGRRRARSPILIARRDG